MGREICKIRFKRKIKFKHTTTASMAEKYTQRSGSYNTRSKIPKYIQLQANDIKKLYLIRNTRSSICKVTLVPALHQGTTPVLTQDYTRQ